MPSPRSSVTPSTYTFRVRILGGLYAPLDGGQIWRELELTGDQTLGDLGAAIPLAFGFDDPHLWAFFLSGKPWDGATEYALSPSPDPVGGRRARAADRLRIRDAPAGKEFLFLFDYGDEWHFGVRLVRTRKAPEPDAQYRRVVASHGQAPPQYPPVEEDWDEQTEDDEEFLAQWEQAEAEAVEVLRQALPAPMLARLPAGELTAACQRLRAGLAQHDPAVETIRRAAGLDPMAALRSE